MYRPSAGTLIFHANIFRSQKDRQTNNIVTCEIPIKKKGQQDILLPHPPSGLRDDSKEDKKTKDKQKHVTLVKQDIYVMTSNIYMNCFLSSSMRHMIVGAALVKIFVLTVNTRLVAVTAGQVLWSLQVVTFSNSWTSHYNWPDLLQQLDVWL